MYLPLKLKLFIPLFIVTFIGVAIVTFVWLPHNHKLLSQDHHKILMVQLENISQSISVHLLANDLGEFYSILDSLQITNPGWLVLNAYDSQQRLIYPLEPSYVEMHEYMNAMEYPLQYKNKFLGHLEVIADFSDRHEELNHQRWQLLIIIFGGVFIISIVAGVTMELAVRRPVGKLVEATRQISLGNYDAPLPRQGKDEIGNLVNRFDRMRSAILEQRQKTIDEYEARQQVQLESQRKSIQITTILDNTTDAYLELNNKMECIFANTKAESLFDVCVSSLLGKNIWDYLPELGSYLYKPLIKAQQDQSMVETEIFYSPKDIWLETHLYTSQDGISMYLRDITARKQVETALRESERYQRAILTNIADGIITTDKQGVILSFNPAAERIYGYSANEAIGNTLDILIDKDLEEVVNQLTHYYNTKGTETVGLNRDVTAKRKDGSLFPVEITITEMLMDESQQFVGIIRDVTERRRAEEQLHLADRIFESNNEGIVITDQNSRILRVNTAFLRITGYTEHEVMGKTPKLLSSGRHSETFYLNMWQQIKEHGHWQGEIWNKRKNGEIYPEWLSISTVHDKNNGISNFVAIFSDISEKKENEQRIYHMAHHDALTGLLNRNMFNLELNEALVSASKCNGLLAVLYIDLDHFKKVNDTLGHPVGDELLKIIAKRLTNLLRSSDQVCRIGGDEFIVLLQNITQADHASKIAQNIIDQLTQPINLAKRELFIGASIGVAMFPQDAMNADDLVCNADAALFRAKQMGRNNFQFYSNDMNARAADRLDLESKLRHALDAQEFVLYFQPQLDLQKKKIIGVEALVRWLHPELGLVSPADFIPLLEETGLIIPVGEWILMRACLQARSWKKAGLGDIRVAVNISPHQFLYSDIIQTVDDAIKITGLPAHLLELEITEGSIMEDAEHNIRRLQLLSDMGVQLAIDDFGTGYSSLAYLKRFPIDALKIDQSFIRDMHQNKEDANIATAIISLGKSFDLRIVAEGVEQAQVLKQLNTLDCDEAQGYFISRPLSEEKMTIFLQDHESIIQSILCDQSSDSIKTIYE